MAIIGYARVSTDEQDTSAQRDALHRDGCAVIFEDKASDGSRDRPNLARALARVGPGDTLLVVRIDRLARSLAHLLEIVETLRAKGGYFRSITDPIDTASPQDMLMTQMLGAFAEFERALIRQRTRAGLKAAVARGAKPGNPKMRARDPVAISDIRFGHNERHLNELLDGRHRWLPTVERLRPHLPWGVVVRQIRAISPPGAVIHRANPRESVPDFGQSGLRGRFDPRSGPQAAARHAGRPPRGRPVADPSGFLAARDRILAFARPARADPAWRSGMVARRRPAGDHTSRSAAPHRELMRTGLVTRWLGVASAGGFPAFSIAHP